MNTNITFHPFLLKSFYKIFGKPGTQIDSIKYLYKYIKKLKKEKKFKTITILEEKIYVEKFYLRDYSRYYAEAFSQFHRFTRRIHFFSCKLTNTKVKELINSDEKTITNFMNEYYLGYVIVKPVKDEANSNLIGRSALRTYPEEINNEKRHYLKTKCKASLFGIESCINTIPFHEQDIAVGACASACIWMAQFVIKEWFNIPILSLAEITELSRIQTPFASPYPTYPSSGLTSAEIANYLQYLKLHFHRADKEDTEYVIESLTKKGKPGLSEDKLLEDLIKAYFNAGFPIICGLQFFDSNHHPTDLHAVLLTGYKENIDGNIVELYVHDDQIGPYCCTELDGSIKKWKNEWLHTDDVSKVELYDIIIPVDPLVKLQFLTFYSYYYYNKSSFDAHGRKSEPKLYHINDYKKQILSKQISLYKNEDGKRFEKKSNPKLQFLSKNMPRYVWVIHITKTDKGIIDAIFDANETLVRDPIAELHFEN